MKIIVAGLGEVGRSLCESLSEKAYDVTAIECDAAVAEEIDEAIDAKVLVGNGASATLLRNANIEEADYFLAMTLDDNANMIACTLAKALGAKVAIARIHNNTYTDNSVLNYQLHFDIDLLVNPEALSAAELAGQIRNPSRLAVEKFSQGEIELQQVTVNEKSRLASKTFGAVEWNKDVHVALITYDKRAQIPEKDTSLIPGSRLTLVGKHRAVAKVKEALDPDSRGETTSVVIFGASETAIGLIRFLQHPRFKIRLIERQRQTCRRLAEQFPWITVIEGSATSLRIMEEEKVGQADYFVACTRNDEVNVMTCLQARQLGVKNVQLVSNKSDYEETLEIFRNTLDIALATAPWRATVKEVLHHISPDPYTVLATLPKDQLKIVEARITETSVICNRAIQDISLPNTTAIAAILHKFKAKLPQQEDVLLPGDRIIFIAESIHLKSLIELIA